MSRQVVWEVAFRGQADSSEAQGDELVIAYADMVSNPMRDHLRLVTSEPTCERTPLRDDASRSRSDANVAGPFGDAATAACLFLDARTVRGISLDAIARSCRATLASTIELILIAPEHVVAESARQRPHPTYRLVEVSDVRAHARAFGVVSLPGIAFCQADGSVLWSSSTGVVDTGETRTTSDSNGRRSTGAISLDDVGR